MPVTATAVTPPRKFEPLRPSANSIVRLAKPQLGTAGIDRSAPSTENAFIVV